MSGPAARLQRASASLLSSAPSKTRLAPRIAASTRFQAPAAARASSNTARRLSDKTGSHARTDDSVKVEYPESSDALREAHPVKTLPTFSLEKRVVVVTGGARGLGLVMGQGAVASGADLAIVDLNSRFSWAGNGRGADEGRGGG